MINVADVSHHYGLKPVLSHVNFRVPAGQLVAVMGPNGVGKSTLLGIIAGLIAPAKGHLEINGLRRREPRLGASDGANLAARGVQGDRNQLELFWPATNSLVSDQHRRYGGGGHGAANPTLLARQLFHFNFTGNRRQIGVDDPRLADHVADNSFKYDITESESLLFGTGFGVSTDIQTGPNGNLFVVSLSHGAVYEIFRRPPGGIK